ncbi:hypothetical protein CRG98_025783 [Punica granatum]|uniref:Uncharacterized protein n=1 Tax=Punica granatum TaxID=22663 RepID=A0A2I0JC70_PUNGR|nr:hypothetical protein CRG98_025783 [Punica granatum]
MSTARTTTAMSASFAFAFALATSSIAAISEVNFSWGWAENARQRSRRIRRRLVLTSGISATFFRSRHCCSRRSSWPAVWVRKEVGRDCQASCDVLAERRVRPISSVTASITQFSANLSRDNHLWYSGFGVVLPSAVVIVLLGAAAQPSI